MYFECVAILVDWSWADVVRLCVYITRGIFLMMSACNKNIKQNSFQIALHVSYWGLQRF